MKTKHFLTKLQSATMILAVSLTLSSCSDLFEFFGIEDNNVVFNETDETEPTVENENVKLNAAGAKITAASAAEATSLLETLIDDIKAKGVGEGKEYVIELAADDIQASSDIALTIPKVVGANLNLKFDNTFKAGTTLNIDASETSSDPVKSVNTLVITLPAAADDLSLNIDMPETTVTLKSAGAQVKFNDVKSRTALNTLVIDEDVEVETMDIQGGTIQVNEGGILDSWVFSAENNGDQVNIYEDGRIEPLKVLVTDDEGNTVEQWQIGSEDGKPYYARSLKIAKGNADYSVVWFGNAPDVPLKTVVVGDGATLQTNYIAMQNIVGEEEGTGVIKYRCTNIPGFTDDTEWGGYKFYEFNSDISGVENVKKVTFSQPEIAPEEWVKPMLEDSIAKGYYMHEPRLNMDVDGDVEGCTFNYNHVFFCNTHSFKCPTVKDCKFKHVDHGTELSEYHVLPIDNDLIEFQLPIVYDGSTDSNSITFENCDFSEGTKFWGYFFAGIGNETPEEWSDGDIHFTGYINFKNCTIGGADFSDNTDFIKELWATTGTKFIISFNGVPKYEVVWDSENGGFTTKPIE